jgi:hypothetical protein
VCCTHPVFRAGSACPGPPELTSGVLVHRHSSLFQRPEDGVGSGAGVGVTVQAARLGH